MTVYKRVAGPGPRLWAPETRRSASAFTRNEWIRLAWLYGAVALLHGCGWGFYLHYASSFPALVGLGFVAYLLGMRHAFDADHIAAVDDSVRYLLARGERPLGIGFFFSLGHSTVVFALALAIVFAASALKQHLPALQGLGGVVGAIVSGTFLWVVGILNLGVLAGIVTTARRRARGKHGHAHIEELLQGRGLLNRLFGGRLQRAITRSWHMYPLGLLFGLGFDTATEIGLLAMTAGASSVELPALAVLSLPLLFAAGMTVMDTTDGVLMTKAYDWAFVNPLRKVFYNVAITSLSVVIALGIGTVQLLHGVVSMLGLEGRFPAAVAALDLGGLGYVIVGFFLAAWGVAALVWKFGRIEERYGGNPARHAHPHAHEGGRSHSHTHFH